MNCEMRISFGLSVNCALIVQTYRREEGGEGGGGKGRGIIRNSDTISLSLWLRWERIPLYANDLAFAKHDEISRVIGNRREFECARRAV